MLGICLRVSSLPGFAAGEMLFGCRGQMPKEPANAEDV